MRVREGKGSRSQRVMNLKIKNAWQAAGMDLGVRVITPCEVETLSGESLVCEAHLPDFGSPNGATLLSHDATSMLRDQLPGRWFSVLYEPYERYDRDLFVETLNDWGWFGPVDAAPSWYVGAR